MNRNLYHAVQTDPTRASNIDRIQRAKATWDVLYRNGVFPRHLSTSSRTSADIGDNRNLPYLKDVLADAATAARDEDIIFFTNDDNELHPDLPDYLKFHVSLYGACASFRCEFNGPPPLNSPAPKRYDTPESAKSSGQDLFAFTKAWLTEHWDEIPDFLIGASEWDWCLTMIIRKEKNIHTTQQNIRGPIFPAEIPYGYVAHELHRPGWIDPAVVNASKAQQHNQKLFSEWLAVNLPSFKMNQYPGTPPVRYSANGKEILIVRRSQALGDVLASTCVATALMDMGHEVEFQAHHSAHCILRRHPRLKVITEPNGHCDIDLDGAYELHPQRTQKHFAELFIDRANAHLHKKGIAIPSVSNYAPRILSDPSVAAECLPRLASFPKPWVMICPRSQSWVNRTVPNDIWQEAAKEIKGTKFWLGFNAAPSGIEDLFCRHVDHLIEYIALADLLVSTDTGPAHIACAIGTPLVVIEQQSNPENHFSDQRDFVVVRPGLDCLNCGDLICHINAKIPPCQKVNPSLIASTANARMRSVLTEDISAVVAVYKPNLENLSRCLDCLLPQVQEVIVVGDLDTPWPIHIAHSHHGKLHFVQKQARKTGYGKKCNYGVRHSNGKYIWFCNDDAFPENDVAEKLRGVLDSDKTIGMVSHTLRYLDGSLQYAGKFRASGHFGFGHIDHRGSTVRFKQPVEQESLCGASVLLRREAFYKVCGFDEDYYLYSDDDDLCMRLRKAGWRLIFEPRAEGIHIEHQSTGLMGNITPLLAESNSIFHRKWASYFHNNPDVTKLGVF